MSVIRQLEIHELIGNGNEHIRSLYNSINNIFDNLVLTQKIHNGLYLLSGSPLFIVDDLSTLYDRNIIMKLLKAPYNLDYTEVNDVILYGFSKKLKIKVSIAVEYGNLNQYFNTNTYGGITQ